MNFSVSQQVIFIRSGNINGNVKAKYMTRDSKAPYKAGNPAQTVAEEVGCSQPAGSEGCKRETNRSKSHFSHPINQTELFNDAELIFQGDDASFQSPELSLSSNKHSLAEKAE